MKSQTTYSWYVKLTAWFIFGLSLTLSYVDFLLILQKARWNDAMEEVATWLILAPILVIYMILVAVMKNVNTIYAMVDDLIDWIIE